VRRGSYRQDRHGPLPTNVLAMTATSPGTSWSPSDSDFGGMGPAGRMFIERMLRSYDFTEIESHLLIEAAHAVGRLAETRATRTDDLVESAALQRLELAWSKQLVSLLTALKVQHETS